MPLIKVKNGDRLHVARRRVRPLRQRLRSAGASDPLEAVLRAARRMDPPSALRVRFSARTPRGAYLLLAAPQAQRGNRAYVVRHIVARPRPSAELEVRDEVQARLLWDHRVYRIGDHRGGVSIGGVSHPGLYIVERDRKPVYVGIAWQASVGSRWACRRATFAQLKIPAETERRYAIRVGMLHPSNAGARLSRNARKNLFETVERVMIRYLKKVRGYGLTNARSTRPFTVGKAGISIENQAAKPPYLPHQIKRKAGQVLETGPVLEMGTPLLPSLGNAL